MNGDRRAFGEMNAQEKTHMELMKAYYKDPKSVEKLASTIEGMQKAKNAGKKQVRIVRPACNLAVQKPVGQPTVRDSDQLRDILNQKGFEGQVFSGPDFAKTFADNAQSSGDGDEPVAYKDRIEVIE